MSPVFSARKRADEFDSLVERGSARESSTRDAELLSLVSALRAVPTVEPRAEFVQDLRSQLMAAAATELKPVTAAADEKLTVAPRRTARERRIAAAVGGLAIVGATTSMAVAAQSALPGDLLYPLKRAMEDAHTSVSFGDADKGNSMLANAAGRLSEVDALTRDDSDASEIAATLDDFTSQASAASDLLLANFADHGDEASITDLRDFAATSLATLDQIARRVPDVARDALVAAGTVLASIEEAAQRACPSCDGATIARLPEWMIQTAADVKSSTKGSQKVSDASVTKPLKPISKPHPKPARPTPAVPQGEEPELSTAPTNGSGLGSTGSAPGSSNTDSPLTQVGGLVTGGGSASTSDPKLGDVLGEVLDGVGDVLLPGTQASQTPSK